MQPGELILVGSQAVVVLALAASLLALVVSLRGVASQGRSRAIVLASSVGTIARTAHEHPEPALPERAFTARRARSPGS